MIFNRDHQFKVELTANDVLKQFRAIDNQDLYAGSFLEAANGDENQEGENQQVNVYDNIGKRRVPVFKLQFPHNEKSVRKQPIESKNKKKLHSIIDRIM